MAVPRHIQKIGPRESILERSNNFRGNLTKNSGSVPYLNQIHHKLPCGLFKYVRIKKAVNNSKPKATYIHECLWMTKWDINKKPNLIMLPLWGAYVKKYKNLKAVKKGMPLPSPVPSPLPGAPVDLPCHDREHNSKNGYNRDVSQWLVNNIWNSLSVSQKPHAVDLQTVIDQLIEGEKAWETELKNRGSTRSGTRVGGTVEAWINRRNDSTWFYPFSMAESPDPNKY